jgi:RNA polymerase sigma-70 factor (ECF subfamily)
MNHPARESSDLRQRLMDGEESALAELFSLHRERLWRMVHFRMDQRLVGRIDPEDILQEAYLDAAQRIQHYRDDTPASEFLWLRMVVAQTMIDAHRRHLGVQKRDPRREVSMHGKAFSPETSTSLVSQLMGHLTSPSQAAIRVELSDQLAEAMAEMDPVDQEVLALRHFEELNNHEVAELLGIQVNAASMRYVRALKRLQGILSRFPGFQAEVPHA